MEKLNKLIKLKVAEMGICSFCGCFSMRIYNPETQLLEWQQVENRITYTYCSRCAELIAWIMQKQELEKINADDSLSCVIKTKQAALMGKNAI